MANPLFFDKKHALSLQQILSLTGATLPNHQQDLAEKILMISDVAPLEQGQESELSFFSNSKYLEDFKSSKAGYCFATEKYAQHAPSSMVVLLHDNPYKAYAIIATALYSALQFSHYIASNAVICKNVQIGKECYIGEFVVIEDGVKIGDNCYIDHHTVIKRNVHIGNNARIASHVTLAYAVIGDDVVIHPGTRIGQDGFGFASDETGHFKVPQLGIVYIGNKVEIGANTTIDRGSSGDTIIGDMCKIDNLVQVGHNVEMGKGCIIVSQVGIAGSTKLGNFVVLGGQVGVAGHLNIGNQVQVAAQSGIAQNIPDKQVVGGSPAVPIRQWHRQNFYIQKLINKNYE